jgi:hypothetical protein
LFVCLFVCWWYLLSSSDGSSVLIIRLEWSSCGHQTALLLDRIGNWILYSFLFWSALLALEVLSALLMSCRNEQRWTLEYTSSSPPLPPHCSSTATKIFLLSLRSVIISQLSSLKKSPFRGSSGAS